MADYTEQKAHLNAIINGAINSATVDGQTTQLNIPEARRRLREIEDLEAAEAGTRKKRPRASSVWMGGGVD